MRFLAPEKKQDERHEHHIQSGDEARIARRSVDHARLLKRTARKQKEARDEHPFVLGFRHGGDVRAADEGQHDQRGQQIARGVEQVHTALLPRDPLSHEGRAPNNRNDQQCQICS